MAQSLLLTNNMSWTTGKEAAQKTPLNLPRMIKWVDLNKDMKPTHGVSDNRWRAMLAHINREYIY